MQPSALLTHEHGGKGRQRMTHRPLAKAPLAAGCAVFAALWAAILLAPGAALAQSDTIIIGTTDNPTKLDPTDSYDFPGWWTAAQTHEGLLSLDPFTEELRPALATHWEVSEDGRSYTFHLRRGVTFTDGAPFNAAAVKRSFERALQLNGDPVFLIGDIRQIDVVDDYQVVIHLNEPDATFLSKLAFVGPAYITSPNTPLLDSAEETYAITNARGTVGTGPYRLVQYQPDVVAVFEAYDGYWGEKPKTRRIIVRYFPNASSLALAMRSGEIDIAWRSLNPEDLIALSQMENLQRVEGVGGLAVRYLVFDVTYPPFDNRLIRQAIAYAVDRDAIIAKAFGGFNTPAYTMVPEGVPYRYETFPRRDLDKARELLTQAGYSTANKLSINLWYDSSGHYAKEADVAVVVKASLEETGLIDVQLQGVEWGTLVERWTSGQTGFFLLGWYPDYLDPDNYLDPWLSTEGGKSLGTFYSHPAVDLMLREGRATTSEEVREAIYRMLQQLEAEDVPVIPLWYDTVQHNAIAKRSIKGLYLPADMEIRLAMLEKE